LARIFAALRGEIKFDGKYGFGSSFAVLLRFLLRQDYGGQRSFGESKAMKKPAMEDFIDGLEDFG